MSQRPATPTATSPLRLAVSDFWPGFEPTNNFLWRTLEGRFRLELDDSAPVLVYSLFGKSHRSRRATKVLCTGEPWPLPRRSDYDYSIGWQLRDDERHVRVPVGIWPLLRSRDLVTEFSSRDWTAWAERPLFCNFVYSNPQPRERRDFFTELTRRRFVHSPGAVETNSPPISARLGKLEWQRQFRFTIAFENQAAPGYTSEKLVDALLAGTVPIYWGNPDVELDVDPSCFIAASDFASFAELAEYVVHLDDNRDDARPFLAEKRPLTHDIDSVADAIANLFERARTDNSFRFRAWRALRPLWLPLRGGGVRARATTVGRVVARRG